MKVYCAGPLFNKKEQEEMEEISSVLVLNGYTTFLPQRDGLELTKIASILEKYNISQETINLILAKAIFSLDIYNVLTCDALVLNMNGRVPDEGAMVEAGAAWASAKPVIIYKSDTRTAYNGSDNPMILGLSNFQLISDIAEIPKKLTHVTIENYPVQSTPSYFKNTVAIGKEITNIMNSTSDFEKIAIKLLEKFEGEVKHEERSRV